MKKYRIKYVPLLGNRLFNKLVIDEGGDKTSKTLREFVKDTFKVDVGLYTYGGCFEPAFNLGGVSIKIGRYCSFASSIRYFGANHPMNHAIMSAYFYNANWSGLDVKDVCRSSLVVGNDVWVGYGVIITSKCKNIGNGAVIAAGSVVTKDVPPYAIVAGNPARILRYRFNTDTINHLEKSQWWNLSPEQIMVYYEYIDSPDTFATKITEIKTVFL